MPSSSGCLLEPATDFTGSLMIIASFRSLDCASASVSQVSRVYCLNLPLNEAVFGSTALAGCGGGHMTCLTAACFAASFHIMLWIMFSDCHLVNSLITSVTHSEVRPVCLLSQWRTVISLSVPSFHSVWGLLKVFLPKACMQRFLCRWSIVQSFEATAELGLWQRVNLTNMKECDIWCDCHMWL